MPEFEEQQAPVTTNQQTTAAGKFRMPPLPPIPPAAAAGSDLKTDRPTSTPTFDLPDLSVNQRQTQLLHSTIDTATSGVSTGKAAAIRFVSNVTGNELNLANTLTVVGVGLGGAAVATFVGGTVGSLIGVAAAGYVGYKAVRGIMFANEGLKDLREVHQAKTVGDTARAQQKSESAGNNLGDAAYEGLTAMPALKAAKAGLFARTERAATAATTGSIFKTSLKWLGFAGAGFLGWTFIKDTEIGQGLKGGVGDLLSGNAFSPAEGGPVVAQSSLFSAPNLVRTDRVLGAAQEQSNLIGMNPIYLAAVVRTHETTVQQPGGSATGLPIRSDSNSTLGIPLQRGSYTEDSLVEDIGTSARTLLRTANGLGLSEKMALPGSLSYDEVLSLYQNYYRSTTDQLAGSSAQYAQKAANQFMTLRN